MKIISGFISGLLMMIAGVGLLIGVILRLIPANFPIGGGIPPQSWLEFSAICLLFSLTLNIHNLTRRW